MEECLPCAFGTTSAPGAKAEDQCRPLPQACPAGQEAPPGAVSAQLCGCLPGYGGAFGLTGMDCRDWLSGGNGQGKGWVMESIATMIAAMLLPNTVVMRVNKAEGRAYHQAGIPTRACHERSIDGGL